MKPLFRALLCVVASSGANFAHEDLARSLAPGDVEVIVLADSSAKTEAKRHPLRGVITAVHADRSALMVKHEAIPGVMGAMTMLFKVDAATLKSAEKGQAITGLMSRQGDEWWLHEVKLADTKKNK